MKPGVAISIGLSLMLAPFGWEISSNRESMIPLPVAASAERLSNGQIIQMRGDVQLKRSPGRVIRPTTGTRLYPGDELVAGNGAQVLVQCADLKTWSVKAGENRVNGCSSTTQPQCTPGLFNCPHRGDEIAWIEDIPYIISPRRTALLNDKPMLRWNRVSGATSYTVSVEGEGVDWTTQVSDTQVVYAGEQPLKPGDRYLVTVVADTGASSLDEPVQPGGLNFSLLDETQAQRVQTEAQQIAQQQWTEQAKALALANLYSENGLIADAIATLEKLVNSGVQTAPIYRTLGELYLDYLGLVPQAGAYYSKAVELANPEDVEEQTAVQEGLERVQRALEVE